MPVKCIIDSAVNNYPSIKVILLLDTLGGNLHDLLASVGDGSGYICPEKKWEICSCSCRSDVRWKGVGSTGAYISLDTKALDQPLMGDWGHGIHLRARTT